MFVYFKVIVSQNQGCFFRRIKYCTETRAHTQDVAFENFTMKCILTGYMRKMILMKR